MTDAQRQLLAILVLDFGYDHQPLYGHTPIRHQMAWQYATEGIEQSVIDERVAFSKSIANSEDGGWKNYIDRSK